MLESRSALSAVIRPDGRDGADGRRQLALGEATLGSLVQLGIHTGGAGAVAAAAASILGAALPSSAAMAQTTGAATLFRISPEQLWIRSPDTTLAARLRTALPESAASMTSLEGARSVIVIEGPAARPVLGRLVAVDLDPSVFLVGQFAQTPIHHVGGLLHRVSPERYEFIALRSFAVSTWEMIEDAAHFFGYDIPTSRP